MVCPRMGGAGNPREFDFVKLYPGRDFDIHNGPLAGEGLWSPGVGIWLLMKTQGEEIDIQKSENVKFPWGCPHPLSWANHW